MQTKEDAETGTNINERLERQTEMAARTVPYLTPTGRRIACRTHMARTITMTTVFVNSSAQ